MSAREAWQHLWLLMYEGCLLNGRTAAADVHYCCAPKQSVSVVVVLQLLCTKAGRLYSVEQAGILAAPEL